MNRARPSRFPTARITLLAALMFALASSAAPSAWRAPVLSVARASEAPTTNMTTVGGAVSSKETALTRIQRMVARLNKESSTPEGEELVVARLAGQFRVSPDTLRAQRAAWGLGYGEVAMAYGFARASRKPVTPEDVVEMRRGGAAWPSIASNLGVKIDTVASRMRRQAGPRGSTKAK